VPLGGEPHCRGRGGRHPSRRPRRGRDRRDLAELFGGTTGDEVDKFARCSWRDGPEGAPILDGVAGWFVGAVLDRYALGDHTGYLLGVVAAAGPADDVDELGFQDARTIEPGHPA
jgi:flavin reductase (DIM6/NTAB) family NADH-FMN oxidoreductase RutF